jgi:hypothetical protein
MFSLKNVLASPQTTFFGVLGILTIIGKWIKAGSVDFSDMNQIWMLITSMGLIAAKDAGTTNAAQPSPASKVP